MNLAFNQNLAKGYTSKSQVIRVLSEAWTKGNMFCPNCDAPHLSEFENNRPVADFFCGACGEEFELKSKGVQGDLPSIIVDGAYDTMLARINSVSNPNFFFLTYNTSLVVNNFLIVPKHLFTPAMIIKRKPLSSTAKRANWVGCNINLQQIPSAGKVFIVKNGIPVASDLVRNAWQKTLPFKKQTIAAKGWLFDLLNCVENVPNQMFNLQDMYAFEATLKAKHPENNFIKDKIRQQLQQLRDLGFIEFLGKGCYKKL